MKPTFNKTSRFSLLLNELDRLARLLEPNICKPQDLRIVVSDLKYIFEEILQYLPSQRASNLSKEIADAANLIREVDFENDTRFSNWAFLQIYRNCTQALTWAKHSVKNAVVGRWPIPEEVEPV